MMKYRHADHADMLRTALKALKLAKVAGALFLTKQLRHAPETMSRSALEEFSEGRSSEKVVFLSALWDFLHSHEVYKAYFPDVIEQSANHELLGKALATVLRVPPFPTWTLGPSDVRSGFLGEFVMFHPPFSPVADDVVLQVMQFSVTGANVGVVVGVNNPSPTYTSFSSGMALPFGDFLCFATLPGKNDEGCLVGIVQTAVKEKPGEQTISLFRGLLFSTDGPINFPLLKFYSPVRFFCRRLDFRPDWPLLRAGAITTLDGMQHEQELQALLTPIE